MIKEDFKNKLLNIFIYVFWIGIFWGTYAESNDWGIYSFLLPVKRFFTVSPSNMFPGFELLYIILFLFIFTNFKNDLGYMNSQTKKMYLIHVMFIILAFINPNNSIYGSAGFLSFIVMKTSRTLLLAIFSIYVLFSLSDKNKILVVSKFLRIGMILVMIKVGFDIIIYTIGQGPFDLAVNKRVTTKGGDVHMWIAFMHVLFLLGYIYSNKKKMLYWSILTFICLLLTYKRAGFLSILLFDFGILVINTIRYQRNRLKSFAVISISTIALFIFISQTQTGNFLMKRMGVAFHFLGIVEVQKGTPFNDSGHLLQSINTTDYLLENIVKFWGGGINRRIENYQTIEGQSQGAVHNNIASYWQYFGLSGVIYYLFLFYFFISQLFKNYSKLNHRNFKYYLQFGISLFVLIRMISGWLTGDFFFLYIQLYFFYILIFAIFSINNQDFSKILVSIIGKNNILKIIK